MENLYDRLKDEYKQAIESNVLYNDTKKAMQKISTWNELKVIDAMFLCSVASHDLDVVKLDSMFNDFKE